MSFCTCWGRLKGTFLSCPSTTGNRKEKRVWQENPIGSGPWKFSERKLGEYVEFEANADYWDGQRIPAFEKLRLVQVEDAAERLESLRSGRVDVTIIDRDDVEPLKEDGIRHRRSKVRAGDDPALLHELRPVLPDLRPQFPQGAGPRERTLEGIVDALYPAEVATLAGGSPFFSPPTEGYDAGLPPYSYDPAEAQRLLRDAGYDGETVHLLSLAAYGLTEMLDVNEMLVEDWRELGVNVELVNTEFPQMLARWVARPQEFDDLAPAPIIHGAFPHTSRFNTTVQDYMAPGRGGRLAYPDQERGDALYQELSGIVDPVEREERLRLLNREAYEEYWAVPVIWRHQPYAFSSNLTGWQPINGTENNLRLETVRPAE